jgi:hypothetical protein
VADEITLTIPREPDFHGVAFLVLGGLAVRLNLTVENLEDLQIALDSILDRLELHTGEITVRMAVHDGELVTRVGPLAQKVLDEIEREQEQALTLRRVLESTVDDVHVDGEWVSLTKKVAVGGDLARG